MKSPSFACTVCIVFIVLFRPSTAETVYSCSFENVGDCELNIDTMAVTWALGDQSLDAGGQGPTADHTWGTASGQYVYSPSSDRVADSALTPKLTTNNLRLTTGEGVLSFYYFLWGGDGNGLNVHVTCDDVTTSIWEYASSGGSMKTWTRAEASVLCNGSFKIMFQSVHNTNNSNVAIDDITLTGTKTGAESDVSTNLPASTDLLRDKDSLVVSDLTSARPQVLVISTMSTGGVGNRPQETVTLAIILFLLALLFMIISIAIHCYIWQKRRAHNNREKSKQISVHNSSYKCPVHTNQPPGYAMDAGNKPNSLMSAEWGTVLRLENGSVPRTNGANKPPAGALHNGPPLPSPRERSKTVPNKRSFEYYESIEMQEQEERENDDKSTEKRILSDKGDKRKQGFLEKARHFTRSNSLPISPAGCYESIDHGNAGHPRPLAYQVTDLMSDSHSTLIGDHHSSTNSIQSIPSNYLKPPTIYDNLERMSPLLKHPSRRSSTNARHSPLQLRLNLSNSHGDVASLYDTTASPQCDAASLSSYETPTARADVSPSVNIHLNPFFQPVQTPDTYNSFNRKHRTSPLPPVTGEPDAPPLLPQARRPVKKYPDTKSNYADPKPTPNVEYHTLDPDAVSDASFERSASETSDTLYECPQTSKKLQHVKSESSHDYEDLD